MKRYVRSGKEFKTSTIDDVTGMELLLSDVSYNRAVDWLMQKGFTEYDRFDVIGDQIELEFSKPAPRIFVYDESRGYLLGN